MYLKNFRIKNFRGIRETTLNFSPGINILIGENNAGKTSVLDALRICLGFKEHNALRVRKKDFNIFYPNEDIEFDLIFSIKNDYERACFIELYNASTDTLDIHFRFNLNNKSPIEKINSNVWGGENEGQNIPNEIFQLFINVYLSALRDAKRYLTPGRSNILGQFLSDIDEKKFSEDYDKEEMIDDLNNKIENSSFLDFVKEVNSEYINDHLKNLTFDDNNLNIEFTSLSKDFEEYAKNLKINIHSINNITSMLELDQNGLGYNNIIYMSILLSRLSILKEQEDSLFLSLIIEEPEAHLQPQLQNLFFSYLDNLNEKLNSNESFQIFISSHSPTLTAKANLNSINILQKFDDNCVNASLCDIIKEKENRDYLHKFLDVTKSQLLFSKRLIFVEGISEALLIPIFAKKLDYDLDKKGIEIVIIQGLSFKHFVPLFENNDLFFKGVIITDNDKKSIEGEESETYKIIKSYEIENILEVYNAEKTFEYELLICNEDDSVIIDTFRKIHPKIFKDASSFDKDGLFKIFDEKRIRKADIALELSKILNDGSDYNIPDYIQEALDFICGD